MKLILLDIDGVLVPAKSWERLELLEDGFAGFKPYAVKNLNKILDETGAAIILISSHKNSFSIPLWKNIFRKRGVNATEISSLDTSNYDNTLFNRASEILRWYENYGTLKDFVVIDDDTSLNNLPWHIKRRCVVTKPLIGLDKESAEKAIQILMEEVD